MLRRLVPRALAVFIALSVVGLAARPLPAHEPEPSDGWTLHIDAKKHLPGDPQSIAHHYCKGVSGGLTECQLYDSDRPDARLVGVEVIVGPDVYAKFPEDEKKLWHYHKTEIDKVDATLPGLSEEEAAKVVKSIEETYGKIYVLWEGDLPVGQPMVTIIE